SMSLILIVSLPFRKTGTLILDRNSSFVNPHSKTAISMRRDQETPISAQIYGRLIARGVYNTKCSLVF
ncbi:hypothetical protein, partial [Candidatus Magnetobacterium casense]|uniref:hypothetical protein n=1 Tax=Candidatus Magnetobacterium casense TaxID=1455061 RepID=UPI001C4897EC